MIRSSLFIAAAMSSLLLAGAAMAATASNLSSGGEAGSSGLGAEQTPKMNGNDPAATGMAPAAQQNGAMMNSAPAGDANMSTGTGAVGAMKDSNAAMKGTTQ